MLLIFLFFCRGNNEATRVLHIAFVISNLQVDSSHWLWCCTTGGERCTAAICVWLEEVVCCWLLPCSLLGAVSIFLRLSESSTKHSFAYSSICGDIFQFGISSTNLDPHTSTKFFSCRQRRRKLKDVGSCWMLNTYESFSFMNYQCCTSPWRGEIKGC